LSETYVLKNKLICFQIQGRTGTDTYSWDTLNNLRAQPAKVVIFAVHMHISILFDHGKFDQWTHLRSKDIGKSFFLR